MHRKCMVEHVANCNVKARAERAVASADVTIDDNTRLIANIRRRLAALEEEVRAAERAKAVANQVLRSLV